MNKAIHTIVIQREVFIVDRKDYPDYDKKSPGSKWILVDYKGDKFWTPGYTLETPKIDDYSKIEIVTNKDLDVSNN